MIYSLIIWLKRPGNKRKNVKFFQELRVKPDILGITRNP